MIYLVEKEEVQYGARLRREKPDQLSLGSAGLSSTVLKFFIYLHLSFCRQGRVWKLLLNLRQETTDPIRKYYLSGL